MKRYTRRELRLLLTCLVAYTAAYISRTNLSPVLDTLQRCFGVSSAQIGFLPTLFAIPYAAGQVVSGYFTEKHKPENIMLLGMLGSAAMNGIFSLSRSYGMLLAVWFLNGCFQSMIWTPVVCILAREFREAVRDHAMFFASISLIAGYLLAWLLSGMLTSRFDWRVAFRTAGATTAVIALICYFLMRGHIEGRPAEAGKKCGAAEHISVWRLLIGTDLIFILLCCVFSGYVRDSIMNWAPKMLMDTQGIDLSGVLGVILIIPVVNFFGIETGKILYHRLDSDCNKTCLLLMLCCAVFALILPAFSGLSPILCALLLALCSAMAYALNPMLTSIMPLKYEYTKHVPLIAGMLDAAIYVGSAFSGFLAGWVRDRLGWTAVYISWAMFSFMGVLMLGLANRSGKYRR